MFQPLVLLDCETEKHHSTSDAYVTFQGLATLQVAESAPRAKPALDAHQPEPLGNTFSP